MKLIPYAQNTLTTYWSWSTVSPTFREQLYDVDLDRLGEDEVTDLCAKVLDYKWQSPDSPTARHGLLLDT